MGTFGKTLSLISFTLGIVISVLVYAQYSQMQSGVIDLVSSNVDATMFVPGSDDDDTLPTLSTVRVSAPKNGSEAKTFEIEHVDEMFETGVIVEHDGTERVAATEEEVQGLPEDATFGERLNYYFKMASVWLFGEKEDKIEMNCSTKRDGGKVCSVSRG